MQAVRDIQSKHQALLQKMPEDMRCRMELHVLEDGIYRAAVCSREVEKQRFLERRSFLAGQLEKVGSGAEGIKE
jgi:hypothetical protein